MCLRLSAAEVWGVFGQQVGQFDVQCLGDGEDAAQPGVCRGVRVRFPSFKLPVGEAREARFGRDPVLGVSLGGACSGDVDAEFSGIVLPGRISVVHKFNANRMSCLHGHVCMT